MQKLNNAEKEIKVPITLGGVGDPKIMCQYGIFKVKLPLYKGNGAVMSGPCLDEVTAKFPTYPLKGCVQRDINDV